MRIMLFPKLIKDEETTSHCLKNCAVVIDGNNFFYDVYEESKLPFVFGSEANQHARYLRCILGHFKKANVKCYFVFKGGNDSMTKKLQRSKPNKFDFGSNYTYVPPIFLKEVCKQVLQETGVDYATCINESKDDCVALAHQLGCSVLSNDIEFCFKKAPYIPYTTIKYTNNGVMCGQYNIEDFLNKHDLTHKKLAIFAALSDTNVFPQNHFNALFQKWGVTDKNLYSLNKNLLNWLSKHSEDEIINKVLEFLTNKEEREKFSNEIENILDNMHNDQTSVVADYLYNGCELNISRSDPLWFEKGVATQNIAIPYINLCKHKLIAGSSAIEKKCAINSLMVSVDIIKYAYNLLTNFQGTDFSVYDYHDQENMLRCVTVSASVSKIRKPACKESGPVFQNGWKNIKRLKLFEHFLNENDINTDTINKLPGEARMLVIALTYFARQKASERVDVTKLANCFIVCHVLLRIVYDRKESLRKKTSRISENDSAEAIRATEKYFKFDKYEAMRIYDGDDLKTMVELQLCLTHMNYLNALCGAPYKPTVYHRSFNGTFVYQLWHDMSDHNHERFIEKLFQAAPSVYNYINSLMNIYKEFV